MVLYLCTALSIDDLNELKRLEGLLDTSATTFLTMTAQAVDDMVGNDLVAVTRAAVNVFAGDATNPVLVSFDFDMSGIVATLTMTFSETVDASTVDVTQLTLQSSGSGAAESFTLTGGTASVDDSTVMSVDVTHDDLNAIKALTQLATLSTNTYLSIGSGLIADMNGNAVVAIAPTSGLVVTTFVADVTAPELVAFDLDMDSGVMTLSFSETVLASSLAPIRFTLDNAACATASYTLTGGTTSTVDSDVLTIALTIADLNNIKYETSLATATGNTYVSVTAQGVHDMAAVPNAVVARASCTNNLGVTTFVADTTAPVLVSFDLNMEL